MRFLSIAAIVVFAVSIPCATAFAADAERVDSPGAAEVASHDAHAVNWLDWSIRKETPPLLYMFFNLALVGVIVFLILRNGLGAKIRNRRSDLELALKEAEELKKEARSALALAKGRAEALDLEMAKIRKDILEAGKAGSERIEKDAQLRAERMKNESSALVQQEIARLSDSIRREIVEDIVALAEKKISEKISSADQEKIAASYLESVENSVGAKQ